MLVDFKTFLYNKLQERGMKPSQLAHRSGISNAEVSRLLSGKRAPSLKTIQKIGPALKIAEEDLLAAASGHAPSPAYSSDAPQTVALPIVGECPANTFNLAFENITDTLQINRDLVRDRKAFCLKVRGDCLRDIGIYSGDLVIVSPQATVQDGNIVIARAGNECTMKKFHRADPYIILMPCNHDHKPIILNTKNQEVEIIGKVIVAIKTL